MILHHVHPPLFLTVSSIILPSSDVKLLQSQGFPTKILFTYLTLCSSAYSSIWTILGDLNKSLNVSSHVLKSPLILTYSFWNLYLLPVDCQHHIHMPASTCCSTDPCWELWWYIVRSKLRIIEEKAFLEYFLMYPFQHRWQVSMVFIYKYVL
jgi:hypothetical protein